MKIWINKIEEESPNEIMNEALIFNLMDKNNKSNVKTHIEDLWRRFGVVALDDINEDILILAMSVFAIDKKVPRKKFNDNWTRNVELYLPVIEIDKWNVVKNKVEDMLGFLSGDIWTINFRKTNRKYRGDKVNKKYKLINKDNFDCVSLFSGGLDSFCGALKLLSEKERTCFVGFKEYKMLGGRQLEIFKNIDEEFMDINKELILFNTNPGVLLNSTGKKINLGNEITSRSRSFLFLAGALGVASIIGTVPVYIPENGFIGLNVPLTDSRIGSCSTRTTHTYFISSFNSILSELGIKNKILNPYALKSKGEIVLEVAELKVFNKMAYKTISCSHPCHARYDKLKIPMNCGYCYPCLIRKASMNKAGCLKDKYNPNNKLSKTFIENNNLIEGKAKDLKALMFSLNRYIINKDEDGYINSLLMKPGKLEVSEIKAYNRLYRESMEEFKEMILAEDCGGVFGLSEYLGVEIEECKNE